MSSLFQYLSLEVTLFFGISFHCALRLIDGWIIFSALLFEKLQDIRYIKNFLKVTA